jgi:hypothetical protein
VWVLFVLGAAVLALLVIAALAAMTGGRSASDDVDVQVVGCTGSSGVATATVQAKNLTSDTLTARVDIEYRDGAGRRLDTDRVTLRAIAAGDTAVADESTILDAAPGGSITCVATKVDVSR